MINIGICDDDKRCRDILKQQIINTINEKEAANIIKFTRKVLEEAIKMGGTTIRTYSSVDGVHGLFQQELLVHGKDNGICPECHSKIQKIRVGGRGTYYCEKCQK